MNLITPQASVLAAANSDELSALGIMPARAKTIITLAKSYANRKLNLQPGDDYESTIAELIALPGIGEWTAEYIAMRCLAWPDAFRMATLE